MNNKIYISPFKTFKGYIQIFEHGDMFMVTLSNEHEFLTISNKSGLEYVNNTDNQWASQTLQAIQESRQDD